MRLTSRQQELSAEFWDFTRGEIVPHAGEWDLAERVPPELIDKLGARGWLAGMIGPEHGGAGLDMVTFGLLNEAIGYGCSSVRSVLTVTSMVAHAIGRWGNAEQRARWLPRLATGECVGAFALTEAEAGSDAARVRTTATPDGTGYVLHGAKCWITYGQAATLFLVFARHGETLSAFLVERDTPGLEIVPVSGVLGTRAARLAEVRFSGCEVPESALVGRHGFGLTAVGTSALDVGRYSVAAGCVGMIQACLDLSARYASGREQFGRRIADHQLVRQLITDMATNAAAARLLCHRAGMLADAGDPASVQAIWMAKYFASRAAFTAAADTVQVHGAVGCAADHPAQRLLRDAKIMEIIEGSTQIQQSVIAETVLRTSPAA